MKAISKIFFFCLSALLFHSCNDEISKGLEAFPASFGNFNDVVVVTDDEIWEGAVGDSLKFYLESSYPIMPAPEPMFDLRHFTTEYLMNDAIRRQLRIYVIVADLNDQNSSTTKMVKQDIGEERFRRALEDPTFNSTVGKDKWARNQLVIYLFSNGKENLASSFKENFNAVAKRIYGHDERQVVSKAYAGGVNRVLQNSLSDKLGVEARVPHDFIQAAYNEEDRMLWLRKETKEASMSVVFQKLEYTSEEQLSEDFIKSKLNAFGKKYVTTDVKGAYLVVNDVDLPTYHYTKEINGQYTFEIRGIWETENDFMGGPYFSYAILSKDQKSVLIVHCFTYAPGTVKRDLMQQLELIPQSVSY